MRRPERRPVRRRGRSGRRRDDAGGCGRRRRRRVPRPPREAGWSGRKRRAGAQGGQAEGQVGAAAVSERASVGGVAGPGARPRQSCGLRGAAAGVLHTPLPPAPGEPPVPRFPLGDLGARGDGTRVRCSHARDPRFPLHWLERTPCVNSESHLRSPLAQASPWVHLLHLA